MCPPMFREAKCKSSLEKYTRNPNFKRNPTHKVPLDMTQNTHRTGQDPFIVREKTKRDSTKRRLAEH